MGTLKTTEKTYRDGTTTVTQSDGIQKRMWVFVERPADDGEADGMVFTSKWEGRVTWRQRDQKDTTTIGIFEFGQTKATAFTQAKNAIIGLTKAAN